MKPLQPSSAQSTSKSTNDHEDEWESEDEKDGEAVAKAHKLDNPLAFDDLTYLKTATLKNGKTATIEHFKVHQLTPALLNWIMDLMERNMKKMYRKSAGGWKFKEKRKEMTDETSRYLIAFLENKPIAFTHFQFDMDYGREVLYCYEIQIEANFRSFGLGKRIMEALEKIATRMNLPFVVLTVFKFNVAGVPFFKNIGYIIDETCPGEDEKKDYVILSKKVC